MKLAEYMLKKNLSYKEMETKSGVSWYVVYNAVKRRGLSKRSAEAISRATDHKVSIKELRDRAGDVADLPRGRRRADGSIPIQRKGNYPSRWEYKKLELELLAKKARKEAKAREKQG